MKKFIVLMFVFAAFFVVSCGGGDKSSSDKEGKADPDKCGNGVLDEGEVCDGDVECWQAGHFFPEGTAKCNSDCSAYDTKMCAERPADDLCGNGQIDSGESCEQGDTKLCSELDSKFTEGTAFCSRNCWGWDPMNCSSGGVKKTCSQIVDCVKDCKGNATCEDECKNSGTSEGASAYSALESCASVCGGVTNEDCLKEKCSEAYFNCNPTQKCGNGTIDDGEICEKHDTKPCEELDPEKWQPINEAVCDSSCQGWNDFSCIDINSLTCMQLYECIKVCTDSECEQECLSKTSGPAKAKYDVMMQCFTDNTCAVDEECMTSVCKFQTDACKTYLTCGNKVVDKDMGEVCDKGETVMKDCGEFKDDKGDAIYEPGTGSAFCGPNCTEYDFSLCHKFCSCAEIQTCIETECGGYPNSNAENTDEKKKCMETCEEWGSETGEKEASSYRYIIENCEETSNGKTAWDSDACKDKMPAEQNWTCSSGNDSRCPY